MSCRNCCPVVRNYVGRSLWDLRHRTGYGSCGFGRHGVQHNEEFNSTFHRICGNFVTYVHVYTPIGYALDWVGDVGVTVCKSGYHGEGRAFDLTHFRFTNGRIIDMNTHWNPNGTCTNLFATRQYIGVAAAARRFVGTVLTAWYNADHRNHIHFDNGVGVVPIRQSWRTDTTLVQATCNYLNGERLAIDGVWGSLTQAAYTRLLSRLRMSCRNPKGNTSDALLFLHLIAQAGLKGQAAGTYVGPC